jgi:DHA2 family methylenomycin A resistance protein-like MFS transporter
VFRRDHLLIRRCLGGRGAPARGPAGHVRPHHERADCDRTPQCAGNRYREPRFGRGQITGVALAGLVLLRVDTDTATLAGLCVVLGVGMGASIAPTQIAGVAALPVQRSGLAAACISTSRQVGTAMGVAILGLVVATHAGTDVGTTQYAEGFVRGLHAAAIVTAAATVVAAAMVAGLARSQSRVASPTRPAIAADR